MFIIVPIEKYPIDAAASRISALDDPLIVDVTPERDEEMHDIFGRKDYVHLYELINKGKTIVLFRSKAKGRRRLNKLVDKAKEFDRELVILYNDSAHLSIIRSLLNVREGDTKERAS